MITTRCAGSDVAIDVLDEAWRVLFLENIEPRQPCPSCSTYVYPYSDGPTVRLREHRRTLSDEEEEYEMQRGIDHMDSGQYD